jgi:hypothetical protein
MIKPTARDEVLGWYQAVFETWKIAHEATPADRYCVMSNALTFVATGFGDLIAYVPYTPVEEPEDFKQWIDARYAIMAYSVVIAECILAREQNVLSDKGAILARTHVIENVSPDIMEIVDRNAEKIIRLLCETAKTLHGRCERSFAGVTLAVCRSVIELTWEDIQQKRAGRIETTLTGPSPEKDPNDR